MCHLVVSQSMELSRYGGKQNDCIFLLFFFEVQKTLVMEMYGKVFNLP